MLKRLLQTLFLSAAFCSTSASESDSIPILDLDVISYEDFMNEDPTTLRLLDKALHEKGIVGMRGIPTYKEKVLNYIDAARRFSSLPENVKEAYAPNRERGDLFLGYERGKEKFKRPDGKWVIDDQKVSYYAFVPDCPENMWPTEVDLKTSFLAIAALMASVGEAVMHKIGLTGPNTGIYINGIPRVGRALHYRKPTEDLSDNPYWCGSHFDLSILTTLLPAFYFLNGEEIVEPLEAGLFVKTTQDGVFKKVIANDPDILLFQVGEFGQLATNDAIRATEHRVHKAKGAVERYTLALFTDAPMDTVIYSTSELTEDSRYGGKAGSPCSYRHWFEESFKRYIVEETPSQN